MPLPKATPRERELWKREWKRPQAVEWERCHSHYLVALYVRISAAAEQPGATAALLTVWRQYADSLGVTLTGLRACRWLIEQPEPELPKVKRPYQRSRFAELPGGTSDGSEPERIGSRFDRLIVGAGATDGSDDS